MIAAAAATTMATAKTTTAADAARAPVWHRRSTSSVVDASIASATPIAATIAMIGQTSAMDRRCPTAIAAAMTRIDQPHQGGARERPTHQDRSGLDGDGDGDGCERDREELEEERRPPRWRRDRRDRRHAESVDEDQVDPDDQRG